MFVLSYFTAVNIFLCAQTIYLTKRADLSLHFLLKLKNSLPWRSSSRLIIKWIRTRDPITQKDSLSQLRIKRSIASFVIGTVFKNQRYYLSNSSSQRVQCFSSNFSENSTCSSKTVFDATISTLNWAKIS